MAEVIEKSVHINASANTVWNLVCEPGWWINNGSYTEHQIEHRGDIVLVTDPTHGTFGLVVVEQDQPRYVSYRWLGRREELTADGPGTLTEFWIEDDGDGVLLRVRESGFESLGESDAELAETIADNVSGWELELGVAKTHVEQGA